MKRPVALLAALGYLILVAHLLFIPYAYASLPFAEALRRFAATPWMELGSDQNVALVSRALMFMPLGALLAISMIPGPASRISIAVVVAAGIVGTCAAAAINFAQLWFPARTVSLNNLTAEATGVLVGAWGWAGFGGSVRRWWRTLASGGRIAGHAALTGYTILYLVGSLAPFDVVTSIGELAQKAASNLYGWWLAPIGCGVASCGAKYVVWIVASAPVGWWIAARQRRDRGAWLAALPVAVVITILIELTHFVMVSGVSQGASVVFRSIGMTLGAASWSRRKLFRNLDLDSIGPRTAVALTAPYLLAVAYVAGWLRSAPLSPKAAIARIGKIVWMPFYYEYFAPYQDTMFSAIVQVVAYAPVAALLWLGFHRKPVRPWLGGLVGALLSVMAETSKIFLAGKLPDYTNVALAGVSAAASLAVLNAMSGTPSKRQVQGSQVGFATRIAGALLLAIAIVTVFDFPTAPLALGIGLAGYALVLARYPVATYAIGIPLFLSVIDLAPYSGRFYWNEVDALLATTLGVRLVTGLPHRTSMPRWPRFAIGLVIVSVIASTLVGVWPFAPLDANAFSTYLSPYNALRVARGYLWAGALLWLIGRDASAGRDLVRPLVIGLAFGLAGAVVGVYWERLEFAGSQLATMMFRASGFNSTTHVGGAYLEATLAMLVPFGLAAAAIVDRNGLKAWWYGIVVASAGAVLMTLSRAAVAAWLIGVVAFAVLARLKSTTPASNVGALRSWWRWAFAAACLIVLPFVAGQSELLWGRLGTSRTDLEVRVGHWRDALALMRERPGSALFGMGLGSFPHDFYLANAERMQLPAYRLSTDASGGLPYLELLGGQGMYVDQRVSAGSARTLRLTGEVRSRIPDMTIAASLCEKSMLNSARCTFARIRATTNWSRFDVDLPSPRGATSGFVPAMPLAFSLANPQFGTRVEVTELSLRDGRRELLRNGSFRHGLDHWFMTSDDHLAWHTKNTALEIFFEQGALGILAWLALAISAVAIVLEAGRRPAATAAFAGSVVAFLAVGTFDSILDSPRIVVLIALIVVTGWLAVRATHLPRRSESATEGPS